MTAVFKREFRDYFSGMFGWIFIAMLALAGGALSAVLNILLGSTDSATVYATLPQVLVVLFPFLTSQTFTKEHAMQNNAWLCSLPIRRINLILGKFAAMLLLFLIPVVLFAALPLLLDSFGDVSYGSAYTALAGYVLMGCALLSVCTFVSSRMYHRIAAVIVNLLLCAAIYFLPVLTDLSVQYPWVGYVACALVCAGIGAYLLIRYRRILAGILTAGIPVAVFTLLYIVFPGFYSDILPVILDYCSLISLLNGFTAGHFDVPTAVYYLSVAVLFVFLTVQLHATPVRKGGKSE